MRLFHFSEDTSIRWFGPIGSATEPGKRALVWAIDEEHAPHYFFPRDCPRVCLWIGAQTSAADRARFFGVTSAPKVIAIERAWLNRLREAKIWVYQMPPETFRVEDENAGYYVSAEAVVPLGVEPLGDPLERLASAGVELRLTPSLAPLRDALVPSTVPFSMIRLRNAAMGPAD